MRLAWKTGLVIVLLSPSLLAQSTWNGLRFGESHAEAAQTLKARGLTISDTDPDVINVQSIYQVSVPDTTVSIPFRVQLLFSKAGLRQVNLELASDSIIQKIGSIYAAMDIVNESMNHALTAKYGAPISKDGACDADSNKLVEKMIEEGKAECNVSWRSEGQLISVEWWGNKPRNSFVYILSYEASSSDL